MKKSTTFWNYKKAKYFWISLIVSALSLGVYFSHPIDTIPNGGTWQGYFLGSLSTLIIVWLGFLGVRKRSYHSSLGTVQGWTSAHIYLGLSLLVLASLHSGFQFSWNVHTFAYVFMVLVILSGVIGVLLYSILPRSMVVNRTELTRTQLLQKQTNIENAALEKLDLFSKETQSFIVSAFRYTDRKEQFLKLILSPDQSKVIDPRKKSAHPKLISNRGQQALLEYLASKTTANAENPEFQGLLDLTAQRAIVLEMLRKDAIKQGLLKAWLYIHIPFTFALLVTLIAHIFSVFYYW